MPAEQSNLDIIQRGQLKWYGYLLSMEDSRWPKKIYQRTPHGRRRRGTSQIMEEPSNGNMEAETSKTIWQKIDVF